MGATLLRPVFAASGYNFWNNEFTFSREDMQTAVASRFPVTAQYSQLMDIRLANPLLSLDPDRSRLRTRLDARIRNQLLGGQPIDGRFTVSNGLRYDAARRAVLLDKPEAEAVEVPGLPAHYAAQLRSAASVLANEVLNGYAIHTFKPEELQFNGRRVEPQSMVVDATGLKVALAFK